MSNLSHTIRKFNRFELKYLLTLQQAEEFKVALKAYLKPDEHGDGRYALTSLYYDSPDLRCYWEKVDGVKFRRKLRIRRYETDEALLPETPVLSRSSNASTESPRNDAPSCPTPRPCACAISAKSPSTPRMTVPPSRKSTRLHGSTTCARSALCVTCARPSSAQIMTWGCVSPSTPT